MYYPHPKELYCSFCRQSQNQVQRLITRSGIYICNECVRQMGSLLNQNSDREYSVCGCSQNASPCIDKH